MSNTKMQEPSVAAWKVIAIWDTKFFLTHAHVRLCFRISPLLLWQLMIYRMEHFGFPAVWVWVSGVRPEQFRFVFVKIIQHRTLKVLNVWPTPICLYGIQNLYPQSKVRRVMSKKRNICEFVPTECWFKLTTKYFNYIHYIGIVRNYLIPCRRQILHRNIVSILLPGCRDFGTTKMGFPQLPSKDLRVILYLEANWRPPLCCCHPDGIVAKQNGHVLFLWPLEPKDRPASICSLSSFSFDLFEP